MSKLQPLVFTDLDGSLLDHHSYSFDAARCTLERLDELGIPVIPVTSKTRAEIKQIRDALGNKHPFVAENGAAVFIPRSYFPEPPEGTEEHGDYLVAAFSPPRQRWLSLLQALAPEFPGDFVSFADAGIEGISRMTGLPAEAAALANDRYFSEPVQWLGDDQRRDEFIDALQREGAQPLQGGRFLTLSANCDKGRALSWLRAIYAAQQADTVICDIAIGDSNNDIAMLEAAQTALLVRSPVHDYPALARQQGVMRSEAEGPAGWAQGVERWLSDLQLIH